MLAWLAPGASTRASSPVTPARRARSRSNTVSVTDDGEPDRVSTANGRSGTTTEVGAAPSSAPRDDGSRTVREPAAGQVTVRGAAGLPPAVATGDPGGTSRVRTAGIAGGCGGR